MTTAEICSQAKAYIDKEVDQEDFLINSRAFKPFGSIRGATNEQENSEFADFENHLNEHIESRDKAHQQEEVDSFIEKLKTEGLPALDIFNRDGLYPAYASKPFLHRVEPKRFVEAFVAIPNKIKRDVTGIIHARYNIEYMSSANPFKVEAAWLEKVLKVLGDYKSEDGKPLLNQHMIYAEKDLEQALELLNKMCGVS